MKIGILFEGKYTMGGGFYLQVKPSLIINEIEKYKTKIEFVVLDKKSEFVFDVALQKLINSEYKFKYYDFYPETTSPPPEI